MPTYQQVTLQDLLDLLTAQTDGSPYWTAEEARLGLNEAFRIWNLMTGQWRTRRVLLCPPSTWLIPTQSVMWMPVRLEWQGKLIEKTSLHDLNNGIPGWQRATGTRVLQWAPAGLDKVAIYPSLTVQDNSSLVVEGVLDTPVLQVPSDYVNIGREELKGFLNYALHYLTFKEGGARFQSTQPQQREFVLAAADKNGRIKASTLLRRPTGADLERQQRPTHRATLPSTETAEEA